jgi:hypothetical protein
MVQFLQRSPSFGELLGQGVGQGLGKGLEFAQQLALKKKEGTQDWENFQKTFQGKDNEFSWENIDPVRKAFLAMTNPKAYKALEEQEEKTQATKGITQSLDWLEKNIQYSGKFGVAPKWGGIEAQGETGGLALHDPETGKQLSNLEIKAKREEINTTGIWMADAIYTHFNKGVLNKEKWEDVKGRFATNADLPAEVNRARMAAARRIMGLPSNAPSKVVNEVINKETKALDKIEKSKGGSSKKEESAGKVIMKAPNGQEVPMDAANVQEALKRGWTKL